MKKATKILALATVLSMSLSLVNVHAAQTTTKIFEEDFNDWTAVTSDAVVENGWTSGGITSGNKMGLSTVAEGDKALALRSGVSVKKVFDSLQSGNFGITYQTEASKAYLFKKANGDIVENDVVESTLKIGLKDEEQSASHTLYAHFGDRTALIYLRAANGAKVDNNWHYISNGETGLTGKINVSIKMDLAGKSCTIKAEDTEGNTYGFTKALPSGYSYKVDSIEFGADGEGDVYATNDETGNLAMTGEKEYGKVDNIVVYQKDAPVTDSLTYLDKDFSSATEDFFAGDLYDGWKYAEDNKLKAQITATDTTGKELITFTDGAMNVGMIMSSNNRSYNAIIPLSQTITEGVFEISFKAKKYDTTKGAGMIKLVGTDYNQSASVWLAGNNLINLNHESNNSALLGNDMVSLTGIDATVFHTYNLRVNLDSKCFNLFIDGKYKGEISFDNVAYCTSDVKYVALRNVTIDDLVVKKAPLMTQYNYYGLREDGTDEISDWKAQWTETSENQYGHFMKAKSEDFWFTKNFGTKLTIANPTGLNKNVMLISAIYDAKGKLYSIAMSDVKTLNTKAANDTELTTFDVKHEGKRLEPSMANYTFKTFLFDSIDGLVPVCGEAIVMPK